MRTRATGLIIAIVLATLLAACGTLPSLQAPTAPPVPTSAEGSATAVELPPAATEAAVASPLPEPTVAPLAVVTPTVAMTDTTGAAPAIAATPIVTETVPSTPEAQSGAAVAAAATPTPEAKVAIPMVAAGGSGAAAETQAAAATTYTIQKGDTLRKIAERFGVTIAAILKANPQIKNADRIYIGQKIAIPAAAGTTRVNIYMIGEGGGSVGCGDQVVAVQRDVAKTSAPLTAALNLLLSQKSRNYGESGLYNALYQSNLRIASITSSGTAWTIRLTGTLVLGGVCDNPRVKAQLEQTALQFSTVKSVRYYVNGKLLDTLLSGK